MDQLGYLVYLSREGNSVCLLIVHQLGSLLCFSREGNSVCLVDQRGSLV